MNRCFASHHLFALVAIIVGEFGYLSTPRIDAAEATSVVLADGGKATRPVVVGGAATERVRKVAGELASVLGKMSRGTFAVETGDGRTGIAVGLPGDFRLPAGRWPQDEKSPQAREDYVLRSHADGLYLIGQTELGVEHAVWDLLHRLGYRQYFPGPAWEVIPERSRLEIAIDTFEHPAYHARRIWYGFGPWDYAVEPYNDWCRKNRAVSGIALRSGHSYDGILHRNKAEFEKHPEYLGLIGDVRKSTKFCISNPGLRELVVRDALAQFAADATLDSVSLDPSDGGNWCQCEKCRALGSVSDRATTLANTVAEGVQKTYPGRLVGMYAYNEHSPPPSIRVHPNVVISVATSFIRGGYTVDQLMQGWQKQGASIGVREYYSVTTWDRDLPGAARGGRPDYICETLTRFHKNGARYFSSESSDNWGPNGLGYYIASRLLWNPAEAERKQALIDEFLSTSFGTAREPMRHFYDLLDGAKKPLLSDDLLGRMFRRLNEAYALTTDKAVHRRLDDLTLYTQYVALWQAYAHADGSKRQAAFEEMIQHVYRMRTTMMVHAKALYRDVPGRDKSLKIPEDAVWSVKEGKNPWKSSQPFAVSELTNFRTRGIEQYRLFDFEPKSFGSDLVPAAPLKLSGDKLGAMGYSRGVRSYWTWVEKAPATISLRVSGGKIYRDRGDVQLALYPAAEAEGKAVAEKRVPADRETHAVSLSTTFTGLHRIEVSDGSAGTDVEWDEGLPMTLRSSTDDPARMQTRWTLYFYVPRGTKQIGGFADGSGVLRNPSGAVAHTFSNDPGYFSIAVGPGEDGKVWKFDRCAGRRMLMTVPPYLARSPAELLLPAEVVRP